MKLSKSFWYVLFAFNWAIILFYWFSTYKTSLSQGGGVLIYAIGGLFGLIAAQMVLTQVFLVSRFPFLERAFGLDRLTRYHSLQGKYGFLFLLFHPVLIVYGSYLGSDVTLWSHAVALVAGHRYVLQALIGFILFALVVGFSLAIVRNKIRYESWYFVHLLVYLAIFFSFGHQIANGSTLLSHKIFYIYWLCLYGFVFTMHLAFRFIRPLVVSIYQGFEVGEIVRESANASSIYIKGRHLEKFKVKSGQFMIFRFLRRGLWWQAHPFSLSAPTDGAHVRLTVKELGDFTRELQGVTPGTKVLIDGPYGVFTDFKEASNKILFLAGGIGITPIRSLTEEMLKKGKDVVLMYANKKESEIVFRNEFEDLSRRYGAKIVHVLSDTDDSNFDKGYIDEEKLKKHVPDIREREVYLCGPLPMMQSLLKILHGFGLSKSKIHYENFSLT